MPGSLIGTEVRRVEDPELMRGEGTYVDNLDLGEGVLHLSFVRSPLPHATVLGVDSSAALAAPGVHWGIARQMPLLNLGARNSAQLWL